MEYIQRIRECERNERDSVRQKQRNMMRGDRRIRRRRRRSDKGERMNKEQRRAVN